MLIQQQELTTTDNVLLSIILLITIIQLEESEKLFVVLFGKIVIAGFLAYYIFNANKQWDTVSLR